MYNDTITEYDLLESVRLVAQEILDYNPDETDEDSDAIREAIHEHADSLVNVYQYPCAQEWLAVNMPDPEDYGLESIGTINDQIATAMYCWYNDKLTNAVHDLMTIRNGDEVDETQAELDAFWDTPTREDEVK